MPSRAWLRRASLLAVLALALVAGAGCAPADGPQPIAYDREACSHCRMLISEPRFAAQLDQHLAPTGSALLVLSTDGEQDAFLRALVAQGFAITPAASKDFKNEQISIHQVTRATC